MNPTIQRAALLSYLTALLLLPITAATAPQNRSRELMLRGKQLLYNGKISAGLDKLNEALAGSPQDPLIRFYLAKGYSWNNNYSKALLLYRSVLTNTKQNSDLYWNARFGMAQVTAWQSNHLQAVQQLLLIRQDYRPMPDDFQKTLLLQLGDIYTWMKDQRRARATFLKLQKEFPRFADAPARLAKLALWENRYSSARALAQLALKLQPNHPAAEKLILQLDQIKQFTLSPGSELFLYNTDNTKGDAVIRSRNWLNFKWQINPKIAVLLHTSAFIQNNVDTTLSYSSVSSDLRTDFHLRPGLSIKFNRRTGLFIQTGFTINAEIFPEWFGELSFVQRTADWLDLQLLYRLTVDQAEPFSIAGDTRSHLFSGGFVLYLTAEIYTRVQGYLELRDDRTFAAGLFQQHFPIKKNSEVDLFFAAGNSGTGLETQPSLQDNDSHYNFSLLWTHRFNNSFSLKLGTGYYKKINSYSYTSFTAESSFHF